MKGGLYKMASIISVSIPEKHKSFLSEMDLSPSQLLQNAIEEIISRSIVSEKRVRELYDRISDLQALLSKYGSFVDKHGLTNEWLKEL